MTEFIVVYVTAGSAAESDQLAQTLVGERLAACVNRIKSVRSVYRWQGQVEQSDEELLIIKTRKAKRAKPGQSTDIGVDQLDLFNLAASPPPTGPTQQALF